MDRFCRTELLLGRAFMERLARSNVIVFGLGGVGGHAAEALIRCGIGRMTIVDHDSVNVTNLNRQIHALNTTLGQYKVDAMASRLLDINPLAEIKKDKRFYAPGLGPQFFTVPGPQLSPGHYDYILDCIDTLACKIDLVIEAQRMGIPIISCMGTGNKLDPTRLEISDISKTRDCPLARNMRKELGKRGIKHLKVVYSREGPIPPADEELHAAMLQELSIEASSRRAIPGSVSFVPSVAGLLMAGEVVQDLLS
jgi:tRNA A37 threonylcarbamoyladenosine dehydratase